MSTAEQKKPVTDVNRLITDGTRIAALSENEQRIIKAIIRQAESEEGINQVLFQALRRVRELHLAFIESIVSEGACPEAALFPGALRNLVDRAKQVA